MKLEPKDVAVGVFTSALALRERALSVQETWLKGFPNAFLIGGWKRDPELRMISLGADVGEDYGSALRKQFLGLIELYERFPEALWYFITGCDAFIFRDNLLELLSRYDAGKELFIGGHCGSAAVGGRSILFPSGGPGFALSRPLVAAIIDDVPAFLKEWERTQTDLRPACDVALSYLVLLQRKVKLTYVEGFYFGPPYDYPGNVYLDGDGQEVKRPPIDRPIAYHSLSLREMYTLDAGRPITKPGPVARLYDGIGIVLSRKLHSRSIMNRFSRALFGRRTRSSA